MRELLEQLKKMGIGYRENYGGIFETLYPHHEYSFKILIYEHGVDIQMINSNGISESIGCSDIKNNIMDELQEAFQQVLNKFFYLQKADNDGEIDEFAAMLTGERK